MSSENPYLTADVYDYIVSVSVREEDRHLARIRAATFELPEASMQVSSHQGQFMSLLARLMDAQRAIEVGVFTGYSALCVALALPDDGRMVACEVNEDYADRARRFWEEAGVAHKIDLRVAPAVETLDALLETGQAGAFDLAFIDADKENYGAYYERLLQLIRAGGLILIDNVLWGGLVFDRRRVDPATTSIRSLNAGLLSDDRVDISMLPIGDGLTLARKR